MFDKSNKIFHDVLHKTNKCYYNKILASPKYLIIMFDYICF